MIDVAKDTAFAALFEVAGAYLVDFFCNFYKYDFKCTQNQEKNAEIINVPFTGNKWPDEGASRSDTEEVTKDRFYIEDIYPIEADKVNKK